MSQATSITVHVPLNIRRRGGRTVVIAPDGSFLPQAQPSLVPATADPVLVRALAQAFRWKRMLDEGTYGSVRELADRERVKPSYAAGLLRLTLLAPGVVEAILDGRQPVHMSLAELLTPLPLQWEGQQRVLPRVGTVPDGPPASEIVPRPPAPDAHAAPALTDLGSVMPLG